MKELKNYNEVKANNDTNRLVAGGYICRIINVEDVPAKEYLKIEYDIAEGEYDGYYQSLYDSFGFWGGTFYRSYKDSALGMFKAFTNAVEESCKSFRVNFPTLERDLEGKLIGLVLGEEEYEKNNGEIGTRLVVKQVKSINDISDGKFKIPKKKELPKEDNAQTDSFQKLERDIPF